MSVAEQAKNHALMQRATTAGPSATAGPGVETPTSCIQNEFQDCDSMSVDENEEHLRTTGTNEHGFIGTLACDLDLVKFLRNFHITSTSLQQNF